jgi:pyruvate dehydrogenase E1 component
VTPPDDDAYQELFEGTSTKVAASTTGAFARLLRNLLRDPGFGPRVVPIIPDEARTFGIDALFRRHKIYAPGGQRYEPVDANLLLSYQEAADGQILEEGITEAGGMASFTAAGTAYATWGEPMLPFFIYYSMFGFHRFADLLWAAGDMRARGFLLGATAGRTTLQGEGLQHCDGHSLLFATAFPNLRAYDPAFAYEVAVIVRDGITRMCGADPEDLLYYLTLYNEGFPQPAMAPGIEEGILAGLYRYQDALGERTHRARILASGTTMLAALDARQMLFADYDIAAEVWSATSYKSLRDDAMTAERWNRLHPDLPPRVPYVQHVLDSGDGPVVAVTDFVRLVVDQVVPWMPRPFIPLGTDGFGLSDTRPALRGHFEVDAAHIVTAVLWGLFLQGEVKADAITDAMRRYGIDPDLPDPRDV